MGVRKNFVAGAGAAAMLLLLLNLSDGCSRRFKGAVGRVFSPLQELALRTGRSLGEGVSTVRGFGGLAEENRRLQSEMIHLQAQMHLFESLNEENRRLREYLDFRDRESRNLAAAQVISRSISGWWYTVRINKGSRDGILPDSAVISSDGVIGRTTDVSAHTADVLLVSDPASRISARVSRTGSFGVVRGEGVSRDGYPAAQMRFIHKDIPVRSGDAVVTSGLGGIFPRDILIGYIDTVHMEEGGLYQTATIIPGAVLDLFDVVFVYGGGAETERTP